MDQGAAEHQDQGAAESNIVWLDVYKQSFSLFLLQTPHNQIFCLYPGDRASPGCLGEMIAGEGVSELPHHY